MKGICFKEPLFHATIEGRKTQTRRIMKPQPIIEANYTIVHNIHFRDSIYHHSVTKPITISDITPYVKPRYNVGEVLYLKEPYAAYGRSNILYKYSDTGKANDFQMKWKNKLFMPGSEARYFIKITAVRAERLQDITDEDCIREGITKGGYCFNNGLHLTSFLSAKDAYASLIDKINGKGTWDSNPYVWVYDYELTNN